MQGVQENHEASSNNKCNNQLRVSAPTTPSVTAAASLLAARAAALAPGDLLGFGV